MQLTIWGDVGLGKVTINADGMRVMLTKRDDGAWVPSSNEGLEAARAVVRRALGPVLELLSATPDEPAVKAVPS